MIKEPEDEAFDDLMKKQTVQRTVGWRKREVTEIQGNKLMIDEFERHVRNDLLEEVAQKFEAMRPMTDTAASFAVIVREMKR
jgi:hypothetical protein